MMSFLVVGLSRNDMDDNLNNVIHNDVTRVRSTVLRGRCVWWWDEH